ncbi:hypothetical protein F4859DRAFT_487205 [Xylaria cf. heliscus]|nr:hypothetical protein F4859DRAFT_487205 [Xylaria cf. heliscus]
MGEGAVSGVVRFLCHVPLFYYAFSAINHYNFVKGHKGVLLAPPLSSKVFVAEVFAGPLGIIAFIWNFLLWIPTIYAEGVRLFLIGVVDAIITGFIITALVLEASFIGFNHAQCAQLRPDAAPTSNLIFFQRVGEINIKEKDAAEGTCQAYYAKWYVGLVVAILYAISTISNLPVGTYSHNRDRRSSHCLLSPIHPILNVLKGIAEVVFFFLPARARNAVFFANRYAERWFRYKGSRTKQSAQETLTLLPRRQRNRKGEEKGLHSVLSQEKVAERIMRQLHYADVVNLSLTSRGIREAVFPRQDMSSVEEKHPRYYSCWGKKKYDCWACGIQVCDECSRSARCAKSTVSFHMSLCAAACSKCYYKTISKGAYMRRPCQCTDGRTKSSYVRPSYWAADANHPAPRIVCRDCYNMKEDKVLDLREKRDQVMYSNLTQQPLSCSECSESLSRTGPRWWVCKKCKRECRSKCHSGWSQKLEA